MDAVGVIAVRSGQCDREPGPLTPMLGTPLLLWAVNNLFRALPAGAIVVATDDERAAELARAHGLRIEPAPRGKDSGTGGTSVPGPDARANDTCSTGRPFRGISAPSKTPARRIVADPMRPFCSRRAVAEALKAGLDEPTAEEFPAIERIRIKTPDDLALARAVAAGLPPDHPCVVGIRRMRLPLAAEVRAIVTDVDGVLTDGRVWMDSSGANARAFHMHDGMGARLLQGVGVKIGWLSSGGDDGVIRRRAQGLDIDAVDVGPGEKGARFERLCERLGVDPAETLYLGDDVNDLPAVDRAGMSACPADAQPAVRAAVDLILETPGGSGCFREAAEVILDDARLREAAGDSSNKRRTEKHRA